MKGIRISDYAIFIRKSALRQLSIPWHELLKVMESENPYDENEDLVSFGPHFGEVISEFITKLEAFGLVYGRDFYDFLDNAPAWCQLYVSLADEDTHQSG